MSVSIFRKALFALASSLLFVTSASAEQKYNMTQGVTEISHQVYDLHMLIFWLVTVVGIIVFAVMIYSIIFHRKSRGAVAAQFHESTKVEIVWTTIPFIILVLITIPATRTLLAIEDTDSDVDMSIKVTGHQWKWHYEYLDEDGISFFSALDAASNETRQLNSGKDPKDVENYLLNVDNPLVIPVNKKVRFLITANDVIHSWWVPAFGMKRDAIPGFINEYWANVEKPGTYRGQCAELCGKDHGFMPIVVVVKEEADYKKWVNEQKARAKAEAAEEASGKVRTMAELMEHGEKLYNSTCASCHMANGEGIPNVFPALKGSAIATGPVAAHLDIVINGSKKNPAMVAFGKQLRNVDLAAIITYERNAWGNNTGDVVQPSAIAEIKK